MPLLPVADITCFYRIEGRDSDPVLILSHSLGQDHSMWDPQAQELSRHFRVLRYDIRGHGATSVTPGDYSIAQLADDVVALADALGIDRFAFCGLSLGGMIGQRVAAKVPGRVTHLVLANTSARADADGMEKRRQTVLSAGMPAVADLVMGRFFTPEQLAAASPIVASSRRTLLATNPAGYAGCCAAIRDMDQRDALPQLKSPTLIISGDRDVSLSWSGHGELLASRIPGAQVVHLPTAHLSNLEAPRAFLCALHEFLLPPPGEPQTDGMKIRRAVLGDDHVDRATRSPASAAFQALITEYAWGSVWTRPGLDVRTRRLLVLAATAALGRWEEFRLHVRTGFAHELEWCDLEEVLLQTAIYAGVPAANTGLHIAAEERSSNER